VAVVDLQSPADFQEHHFEGAIQAGGKPRVLENVALRLSRERGDVVVVTARGGEPASRAAKRLAAAGVSPQRISILEGGMEDAAQGARCDCCNVPEDRKK
jgi:rhodanese-related sulfurtransferase